ncbi:MAG: hypothetical protein ACQEP3_00995 [Patescibacteria group bacterium]
MYPQNIEEILEEILEKYELKNSQDVLFSEIKNTENKAERFEKMKKIPSFLLSKGIKKYTEKQLNKEDLINYYFENLRINKEEAKEIFEILEKNVFNHSKTVKKDNSASKRKKPDPYRESIK